MIRPAKPDPKARQVALQIGTSRLAMGVAILFATQPALRMLRFGSTDATGEALAKLGGGRDLALGALTLAVRDDPATLRRVIFVSSCLDLADGIALGISARRQETRKAGIGGVFSGGGAAAAGFWAWRRLGDT